MFLVWSVSSINYDWRTPFRGGSSSAPQVLHEGRVPRGLNDRVHDGTIMKAMAKTWASGSAKEVAEDLRRGCQGTILARERIRTSNAACRKPAMAIANLLPSFQRSPPVLAFCRQCIPRTGADRTWQKRRNSRRTGKLATEADGEANEALALNMNSTLFSKPGARHSLVGMASMLPKALPKDQSPEFASHRRLSNGCPAERDLRTERTVVAVAISRDGKIAIAGSHDKTALGIRDWQMIGLRCFI